MKKRNINWRKFRDEMVAISVVILGIVLMILNLFKITPGVETLFTQIITAIISYGFIIGLGLIFTGACSFIDIRDSNYRKKGIR